MKKRLTALSILVLMTLALAPQIFGQDSPRHSRDDSDYSERDEINQTYQLSAGARVEVRGINGTVDIETSSGNTAEVHIVRSARSRETSVMAGSSSSTRLTASSYAAKMKRRAVVVM